MKNVDAPQFEPTNSARTQVFELSQRAHKLTSQAYAGDQTAKAELRRKEEEVDRTAALWGLTDQELADVKASLLELKG